MKLDLEPQLRSALAARAATVPTGSGSRLRAVDYRPRTHRVPVRSAAATMAGAAAVGTAVAVLGGSQPAFAGWAAAPTQTVDAPSAGAAGDCAAQLAALPAPPNSTDSGPWSPVATDVRGPFTVVVYQDGTDTDFATCFSGPPFTFVSRSSIDASGGNGHLSGSSSGTASGLGGGQMTENEGAGGGDIPQWSLAHLNSTSQGPYTLVEGRIASGVTGVTLVRDDGQDVQATTENGWFIAWWPGNQGVTTAQVTTPAGVSDQSLSGSATPGGG